MADQTQENYDRATQTAAHLALVEIALGSVVHALKLPFAGHALSLNQGFFLCRSLSPDQSRIQMIKQSVEISTITSLLKSLSPAGNKIGPMLSISMQGFLFSAGLAFGGIGIIGQIMGMLLLSLWAFVQPLLTLFVIHGLVLATVAEFYWKRMAQEIPWLADSLAIVLICVVTIKLILAASIPILARFSSIEKVEAFQKSLTQKVGTQMIDPNRNKKSVWSGVLHDLTRPLFIFSMVLLVSFFLLTESSYVRIFWMSLRPLAVAFVIFYLVRAPWFARTLARLAKKNRYLNQILIKTNQVYQSVYSAQKTEKK